MKTVIYIYQNSVVIITLKREHYLTATDQFTDYCQKHEYALVDDRAGCCPPHAHKKFFELGYMYRGKAEHVLNGERTTISKGDFFIMDLTSSHYYTGEESCELINLLFYPRFIDATLGGCTQLSELVSHFLISYLPQNIGRVHWQIFHDSDGEILRLIEAIAEENFYRRHGYRTMIRSYMIQLLVTIMRQVGDESTRYSIPISDVITIIEQQYNTPLSLSKIASRLNYSPAYLSRTFSEEVGQTFGEYLQRYRLERASHSLANTTLPVCRIAESVGYKDVRFFYQLFKRFYGETPSAYRKKFISLK